MTNFIIFLYGMFSGIVTTAALIVARDYVIKQLEQGWAGSAPTTRQAIKASLDRSKKPY